MNNEVAKVCSGIRTTTGARGEAIPQSVSLAGEAVATRWRAAPTRGRPRRYHHRMTELARAPVAPLGGGVQATNIISWVPIARNGSHHGAHHYAAAIAETSVASLAVGRSLRRGAANYTSPAARTAATWNGSAVTNASRLKPTSGSNGGAVNSQNISANTHQRG